MGILEETVVKAKEIADITGKKAGEIINLQKLRVSAASAGSQLSKLFEALGRLNYETAKNGLVNEDAVNNLITEIDEKSAEIEELKLKIAEMKGKLICPACKSQNDDEAVFCNKCGEKLN